MLRLVLSLLMFFFATLAPLRSQIAFGSELKSQNVIDCNPETPFTNTEWQQILAQYPLHRPFLDSLAKKTGGKRWDTSCEPSILLTEEECWYAKLAYLIADEASNQNIDSIGVLDSLLPRIAEKFGNESELHAYVLNKRGSQAFYEENDTLAIKFYNRSLAIRQKIHTQNGVTHVDPSLVRLYVNFAYSYEWLKDQANLKKYKQLAQAAFDTTDIRFNYGKLYTDFLRNNAEYYLSLEDLDNAVLNFKTIISYQRDHGENCPEYVTTNTVSALNQLATLYAGRLERYDLAEATSLQARQMLDELAQETGEKYDKFYLENHVNYALALAANENYAMANAENQLALQLAIATDNKSTRVLIHNNLAQINILQGNFIEAESWIQQGLELAERDTISWLYSNLFDNLSDVLSSRKDYTGALRLNKQAIDSLVTARESLACIDFSDQEILIRKPQFVIQLLASRAQFQQLAGDQEAALESYRQAAQLIERLRQSFRSDESKGVLAGLAKPIFSAAIKTCWELYEPTQKAEYAEIAQLLSEQSRGLILFDAVSLSKAVYYLSESGEESDAARERDLQLRLKNAENELAEKGGQANSEDRNTVRRIRGELAALREKIGKDNPEYYNWITASTATNLTGIHEHLQIDQSYVEYFTTPDATFALVINGKGVPSFHRLTYAVSEAINSDNLDTLIQDYLLKIKGEKKNFLPLGYRLYQLLIEPLLPFIEYDEVVIVPDGKLANLPFEALPRQLPKTEGHLRFEDYLINEKTISYRYSLALDGNNSPVNTRKMKRFVGIAPDFPSSFTFEGTLFDRLLGTNKLVNELASDYGIGSTVWGSQAKQLFQSGIHHYSIVQIASHALADEENGDRSYVLFGTRAEDKLTAREIYALRMLNTEIVIISACQGALGNYREGEGIISLGRSFFYAGARSVIPTLWSVEENSTLDITRYFHDNIRLGQAKNVALRNAKNRFIADMRKSNDPKIRKMVHPYYWASFIPVGNMNPITNLSGGGISGWSIYWVFGLCLFLLLTGTYARRKKIKNSLNQ